MINASVFFNYYDIRINFLYFHVIFTTFILLMDAINAMFLYHPCIKNLFIILNYV